MILNKNNIHTIIIFSVILFLLNNKFLSNFIWTASELFIDFKIPLNWLECHNLGIDLLTLEKINCGTGKNILQFNYGFAFLSIPYNDVLDNFYRNFLPWLLIFLFVFSTVAIIVPKNKIEILL